MKTLTINYRGHQLSEAELEVFEKTHGLTFPTYLKTFMLQYSGAEVDETYWNDNHIVGAFLQLYNKNDAAMDQIMPYVRNEEYIGRNDLIPFAVDISGKPFYVSTGPEDNGVVYADRVGMADDGVLLKLADSLEEFIDGLKPDL